MPPFPIERTDDIVRTDDETPEGTLSSTWPSGTTIYLDDLVTHY